MSSLMIPDSLLPSAYIHLPISKVIPWECDVSVKLLRWFQSGALRAQLVHSVHSALAPKYKFCDMGARFANTGVGIPASPFGNQVREKKQRHFVAHKQNKRDRNDGIALNSAKTHQKIKAKTVFCCYR